MGCFVSLGQSRPLTSRCANVHGTLKKDGERAKTRSAVNAAADGEACEFECSALLAGLVIDAGGASMVLSRAAAFGAANARYYVSSAVSPALGALERIPAARLDSSVIAILRRVCLLGDEWQREDLLAILRRVVVLEDTIILQLDKRLCLTTWRAREPILLRIATGDALRLVGTCLAKGEEIFEAGTALCLRVPRHSRARKIRQRSRRTALLFQPTA